MIVNPWTVSSLSLDIASTGLGVIALTGAVKQYYSTPARLAGTGELLAEGEDRLYLLFWLAAVFLLLRFLAWPLFYCSLHSIIPEVSGAMCIFGTRNLQPLLTKSLEFIKPLLFFAGLVWLLIFRLERFYSQSASSSRAQRSSLFLLFCCLTTGLADAIGSTILWLRSNAELAVSCCTTITDIPTRFTVWIPTSLFGHEYQQLLWLLFFGVNLLVIGLSLLLAQRLKSGSRKVSAFLLLLLTVIGNSVVGTFAFIEVIAPKLMQLPFHHCIYCLVQNVLDAPLFIALFIGGNSVLATLYPVHLLAGSWAEPQQMDRLSKKLLNTGAVALAGTLVMITTHLLF